MNRVALLCFMILFLFPVLTQSSHCAQGSVTCFKCLEYPNCSYCFTNKKCTATNETEIESAYDQCPDSTETKNRQCIDQLGRDAIPWIRYTIGFSVLGVSLIVDIVLRIRAHRLSRDPKLYK